MLEVHFNALILSGAVHNSTETALPVHRYGGVFGIEIDFAVTTHIVILSGRPCHTHTRSKTVITMAKLLQHRRIESRIKRRHGCRHDTWSIRIYQHKLGTFHLRTPVQGETYIQSKPINNLPTMAYMQIQVLEIIQMYLVKIKDTVGDGFQILQHITTVNTVTITHTDMQGGTLAGPIIEIGIDRPIKLLPFEIITQLRDDA